MRWKKMKNSTIDIKFLDQVTCIDIFSTAIGFGIGRCGGDALTYADIYHFCWYKYGT